MSAVLVNRQRIGILLVDDAALRFRRTANKVRDVTLRIVDLPDRSAGSGSYRRHRTCALILIVLIVALVSGFVEPLCTVLQVEIRCAAVIDETVQIGLVRHKGNVESACGQRKQIAVELYVSDRFSFFGIAGRRPVVSHIHGDCTLIGSKCIVAVPHSGGHLNGAAACNPNFAVLGIRRHAVAIDGHIHITVYGHIALFDLRQDTGVVKAREYILTVERDAPLVSLCACNLQIAVDANRRGKARLIGLLTEAVALLDCDTVAAKSARHGDIQRPIDGELCRLILQCIELNSIRQ